MTDRIYDGYASRSIPRGVTVDCTDGLAIVRRPDGGSTVLGYTGILNLEASKYDTSLIGVQVDGRLSQNPSWPSWGVDSFVEHAPNIQVNSFITDGTARPTGTVYIDGVYSYNAVSDGIIAQSAVNLDIRNCTTTGCARLGIGIAYAGCIALIEDCSTDHLHYEPNARGSYPLASVITMNRVTLTGIRACNLLVSEPDCHIYGTDIATAVELYLEDGVRPEEVTSTGDRMVMTRCDGDATTIYQPKSLVMDDCATGDVNVLFQTATRQWDGGRITIQNRAFGAETWVTNGLGYIDIINCTGDFVIDARNASGVTYDLHTYTPLPVTRAGVTSYLTAANTYTIDVNGACTPTPPAVSAGALATVATTATMDHVWNRNAFGTGTVDIGNVGGANLTLTSTTNYAASIVNTVGLVHGSVGYDRIAAHTASIGAVSAAACNQARTSNVWFEGVFSFSEAQTANSVLYNLGGGVAYGFGYIKYSHDNDRVEFYDETDTLQCVSTLTTTELQAGPVYIAVWWDHAGLVFHLYWYDGTTYEEITSSTTSAGSGSTLTSCSFGYGTLSPKANCHYSAQHRGTLTLAHQNNIFGALTFATIAAPNFSEVAASEGQTYIWPLDYAGTYTTEVVSGANLTETGTASTSEAANVTGSLGRIRQPTQQSSTNNHLTGNVVNLGSGDCWVDLVIQCPSAPTGNTCILWHGGTYTGTGLGMIWWSGNTYSRLCYYDNSFTLKIQATAITSAVLTAGPILLTLERSGSNVNLHYNNGTISGTYTVAYSPTVGTRPLLLGGNLTNIYSALVDYSFVSAGVGTMPATHLADMAAAAGW